MPHTLEEIFTHAQLLDFKNRNSWAGRGWRARRSSRAQRAEPDLSAALLQAAVETTASESIGKEDLKADLRVRHYKEVGLQECPLAG